MLELIPLTMALMQAVPGDDDDPSIEQQCYVLIKAQCCKSLKQKQAPFYNVPCPTAPGGWCYGANVSTEDHEYHDAREAEDDGYRQPLATDGSVPCTFYQPYCAGFACGYLDTQFTIWCINVTNGEPCS